MAKHTEKILKDITELLEERKEKNTTLSHMNKKKQIVTFREKNLKAHNALNSLDNQSSTSPIETKEFSISENTQNREIQNG